MKQMDARLHTHTHTPLPRLRSVDLFQVVEGAPEKVATRGS